MKILRSDFVKSLRALRRVCRFRDALRLTRARHSRPQISRVYIKEFDRTILLRSGTSDTEVLVNILNNRQYTMPPEFEPRFIVDAGANIGIASLYFATCFPDARIIALEPEQSNYELLTKNCAGVPNIECKNAALWDRRTQVAASNPGAEKWAFQYTENVENAMTVPAITVPDLIQFSPIGFIDLLKIDIEGAELRVFQDSAQEWLRQIGWIAIELHDGLVPGCSQAFYSQLTTLRFSQELRGENVIIKIG